MKSIVLINCYFGSFPNYFNLFLESCRKNPTVNFLFFTDNEGHNLPENVKFVNTTFEEIRDVIQSKFDFPISLDAPYKLCDYKPAYGYIFADYISQYDFWGYCDVDMIFGNIRHFLTEDILGRYDKFYKLGHLTVFRNDDDVNRVFMSDESISYKYAFSTKKIAVFDEFEGIQKIFDNKGLSTYFSRDYADITTSNNRFMLSSLLVDDSKKNNYKNQLFVYENDCVYRYYEENNTVNKDEFEYIHLQKRRFEKSIDAVDRYLITYNGFIPKSDGEITLAEIKKYNGINVIKELSAKYKKFSYKLKRKIDKTRLTINEHSAFTA